MPTKKNMPITIKTYKIAYRINYGSFFTKGDIAVQAKDKKQAKAKAKKLVQGCHNGKVEIA